MVFFSRRFIAFARMTSKCFLSFLSSCQHIPLCEETCGGGGGEAGGAEAGGRSHRRDESSHGGADQTVLQSGGRHDPAAAQTAGLRLCAGKGLSHRGLRNQNMSLSCELLSWLSWIKRATL